MKLVQRRSPGPVTVITFGGVAAARGGFYIARATYENDGFGVFAGGSDHFQSGYGTTQMPAPALLFGGASGKSVFSTNIRGYLVPSTAQANKSRDRGRISQRF
jgi:hypothetical protein